MRKQLCTRCSKCLPLDAFYLNPTQARSVVRHCRKCRSRLVREAQAKNSHIRHGRRLTEVERSFFKRRSAKRTQLRLNYGMELEAYDALYSKQNGLCAICGNAETSKQKNGTLNQLAVDHCHETGKIRGLLCSRCNPGIGYFQHEVKRLEAAIKYLKDNDLAR